MNKLSSHVWIGAKCFEYIFSRIILGLGIEYLNFEITITPHRILHRNNDEVLFNRSSSMFDNFSTDGTSPFPSFATASERSFAKFFMQE